MFQMININKLIYESYINYFENSSRMVFFEKIISNHFYVLFFLCYYTKDNSLLQILKNKNMCFLYLPPYCKPILM